MFIPRFVLLVLFAASAAAAATPEFSTTPSGLRYAITKRGSGAQPQKDNVVLAHYKGTLSDGTIFDDSRRRWEPFAFTLGRDQVIKGWDEGFALLRVGDKATFVVPAAIAYGGQSRGSIPPNSTLTFEVELVGIEQRALSDALGDAIDQDGAAAARPLFARLQQERFKGYHLSESRINGVGYRLLGQNKLPEALAVLEINAELFPKSGKAHDGLGEVRWKSGQRDLALASYRKSLALDPKNPTAKKMIAEITAAGAK